jgi:hypothetical protein
MGSHRGHEPDVRGQPARTGDISGAMLESRRTSPPVSTEEALSAPTRRPAILALAALLELTEAEEHECGVRGRIKTNMVIGQSNL